MTSAGTRNPTGPFVSTARPRQACSAASCGDARPEAPVDAPEEREGGALEEREQHVELHAAREVRELEGGEEQRGAEQARSRPPKSRAPSERVRATQAIPASAEGSRAAASLTRPPGAPASAASQK